MLESRLEEARKTFCFVNYCNLKIRAATHKASEGKGALICRLAKSNQVLNVIYHICPHSIASSRGPNAQQNQLPHLANNT